MGHIDSEDLVVAVAVRPPDLLHQIIVSQYFACLLCQHEYQIVLDLGKMNLLTVKRDKPFFKIDHQTAARIHKIRTAALMAVAQGRADAGHQFRRSKGFGDIIIRAAVQSLYLLILLGAGGDDDNGRGGKSPDIADNLHSSMSGSPRSRRMMSGHWEAITERPSVPVEAVMVLEDSTVRMDSIERQIFFSS